LILTQFIPWISHAHVRKPGFIQSKQTGIQYLFIKMNSTHPALATTSPLAPRYHKLTGLWRLRKMNGWSFLKELRTFINSTPLVSKMDQLMACIILKKGDWIFSWNLVESYMTDNNSS